MDLRGAPEPSGPARDALLASFEHTVSLIENAEKLQEWRAAPEQRLALWMRFLPAVSCPRGLGRTGCHTVDARAANALVRPARWVCQRLRARSFQARTATAARCLRDWPPGQSKDNPSAPIRLVTVVPHTASWELRARMLHANIVRSGGPAGES